MIRLGLKSEPYWLDLLPGVRIKVRPFGTALFFAAQSAMVRVDTKGEEASEVIDALRGALSSRRWRGSPSSNGRVWPTRKASPLRYRRTRSMR